MSKYSDITDTQRWFPEPNRREKKSDGAYLMQRSLVDTSSCRDTEHRVRNICIRALTGPNIWMCYRTRPLPGIMLISSGRLRGSDRRGEGQGINPVHTFRRGFLEVSRLSECNVKMVDASLSGQKKAQSKRDKIQLLVYHWYIADHICGYITQPPIKHGLLSVFLVLASWFETWH